MIEYQPCVIEKPGRIIVIGDIHGDIDRLLNILISTKIFTERLEWIAEPPNTVVVQLGDQIDSMDRSGLNAEWDTSSQICTKGILDLNIIILMEKLDSIAIQAGHGGRVLSLIGNHELLNLMHHFDYVSPCSKRILNPEIRKELFRRGNGQITQLLAKRNVVVKVGKYIFCHGGILPEHLDTIQSTYSHQINTNDFIHYINNTFRKFTLNEFLTPEDIKILQNVIIGDNGILWTRFYLSLLIKSGTDSGIHLIFESVLTNILSRLDGISMFIGHNIVDSITAVANSKLFFTDAALSRAFNTQRIQIIEIVSKENGEDTVNLIEIGCY